MFSLKVILENTESWKCRKKPLNCHKEINVYRQGGGRGLVGLDIPFNSLVHCVSAGHHVVHWSRWRALAVLIVATVLMACCADLLTENIQPLLTNSSISQVPGMLFIKSGKKKSLTFHFCFYKQFYLTMIACVCVCSSTLLVSHCWPWYRSFLR